MSHPKTVGIMQPTYLPWLGYLDIMDQVDEFVILDDVQFERHSWQHRNRVKGRTGEVMLTMSVSRTGLHTLISEAELNDRRDGPRHLQTIRQCYARAAGVATVLEALEPVYTTDSPLLVELLVEGISVLRGFLGIDTPLRRASELDVSGSKGERVRAICAAVGATTYLAAPGSREYMEAGQAFSDGAVTVEYHQYEPRRYPQLHGSFVPYLSALDTIINLGAGAREAMTAGRAPGSDGGLRS